MRKRYTTQYPGIRYRLVEEERPDGPRRYIVDYTDSDGRQRSETLPVGSTLEEARARKGELQARKSRGEKVRVVRMSVGELVDRYLERRREEGAKPTTIAIDTWGAGHVKRLIGRTQIRDLTASDVAGMVRKLEKEGKKGASINNVLKPLSQAFKWAVREEWVSSNPVQKLLRTERPKNDRKAMRILTPVEITKLTATDQTLFTFLLFTGLRISEAIALTWDDVDFTADLVHVDGTKTQAAKRDVILIPMLAQRLKALKLAQEPGTELVFPENDRRNPLKRLQRLLPGVTQHELRHTFASILIGQGMDVTFVADQMGHADPAVTLRVYAKLFDPVARRDEARERLQAAFGGIL